MINDRGVFRGVHVSPLTEYKGIVTPVYGNDKALESTYSCADIGDGLTEINTLLGCL